MLRLMRLGCSIVVLYWIRSPPRGSRAPQRRTGSPPRHGLGTRIPSPDTTHTYTARSHARIRFLQACNASVRVYSYTHGLGRPRGFAKTRVRRTRGGVRSAVREQMSRSSLHVSATCPLSIASPPLQTAIVVGCADNWRERRVVVTCRLHMINLRT